MKQYREKEAEGKRRARKDKRVCEQSCKGGSRFTKMFARGVYERLQGAIESILRKQQAGFRRGMSTYDQIFVMRRLIE